MERSFHVGAYAVTIDEEQQVLVCRRRGEESWVLPGGSSEPGEPPLETVVRETEEETRVRVAVDRVVGLYVARGENDLVVAFRCHPEAGAPAPSEERAEVRWLDRHDLPAGLSSRDRQRIDDAFAGGRVRLRALEGDTEPPPPGVR